METVSPTCPDALEIEIRSVFTSLLQLVEDFVYAVERTLHALHFFQLQQKRVLAGARTQQAHGSLPINRSAVGHWKQVLVSFAIVIVDVRRADAVLHDFERRFHALTDIGVADIENKPEIEMRYFDEIFQPLGAREIVGDVFEENLHAAPPCENTQLFQRRKGGVDLAIAERFTGNAEMLNQVTKRHGLRDL